MINSETELYTKNTDFVSVKTNTIRMMCLRPNLVFGLILPMMRKIKTQIPEYISISTTDDLYNAIQYLNSVKDKILNFNKQSQYILGSEYAKDLSVLENSINITERLSLVDGVEVVNVSAEKVPNQYSSYYSPPTPEMFVKDVTNLINNYYVTISPKNNVIDVSHVVEMLQVGHSGVRLLAIAGDGRDPLVMSLYDTQETFENITYDPNAKTLTIGRSLGNNKIVGVRLLNINDNVNNDPLKYSLYYTTKELSGVLGGKPNTKIVEQIIFDKNNLPTIDVSDYVLVFDNDVIVVRNSQILITSNFLNYLDKKPCNITTQNVRIPTTSSNVHEIFGNKADKQKVLKLPFNFLQQGDYISDIEITSVLGATVTLSESASPGNKTVQLGSYKRWKDLCIAINNLNIPTHTLEEINSLDVFSRKSLVNKVLTSLASLSSISASFGFGRLQGNIIKSLNTISNAHRENRYDIALSELFSGNIDTYIDMSDADASTNALLINAIKQAIYEVALL